jgi:hypothetical protein
MAIYQLADGTVVSGTVAAGDASTPSFLIADDGRAVDLTGASEIVQPERTLAEQLGFSPLDIKRYAARGIPEEEVGSRLQSYLQQYGQSPSDVNWWGQNARDRVMGLAVDPRQEAAEQYSLGQAIMRSQQDEPSILGLPASLVQGAGTFASLVGGLNALAGLPSFFSSTGVPGSESSIADFGDPYLLPEGVDIPKPYVTIPGVGDVYGSAESIAQSFPEVFGGVSSNAPVGSFPFNLTDSKIASGLSSAAKAVGSLFGGQTSAGSRTISGATPALQIMRNALENKEEGKNQSPYKAKLPEQLIYTGQPLQVPTLFAGIDPKLIDQMNRRGYAMGGQVEPTEYVPGPEGKYFARHAKRGFAVNGPGTGQSDDIPTMLADGEYVIDSDTVAALGDGSSKAGAAVLDKFREEIRKHKRSAPIDDIPPKAKSPLAYLKEAQKGKKNG